MERKRKRKVGRGRAVDTTPTRTLVTPTEVLGPAMVATIISTHPKIMIIDHLKINEKKGMKKVLYQLR